MESTIQNKNPIGTEKVSKLLFQFSVPAIIGMTINALYNIVDRIFIGNSPDLGAIGLAAITICFPIMIIIMAVGILFGVGGATVFSINLGKGDIERANKAISNATTLLIVFGLMITIIGEIFLKDLLIAFGASEAMLPYSEEYLRIILFGALFQVLAMGMNNFLRANGKPKLSMMTMLIGAIINTILDPIFIYVFRMGMTGAALATIFSMFVSMLWGLYHFLKKSEPHRIRLKNMKLEADLALEVISLGIPGFLLQLSGGLLSAILNSSLLKYGGDIAVSAMGIVNSIQNLLILPVVGLNQGLQPIVSFNYGAKQHTRVKEAVLLGIKTASIISIAGFLVGQIFPKFMVSLFNQDPELLKFGEYAMRTWFKMTFLAGFQIVAANFFQAIGKPTKAMMLTLTRQVLVLIPCIIVFSKLWGLNGILYAAPFADLTSTTITAIFFISFIREYSLASSEKILEN